RLGVREDVRLGAARAALDGDRRSGGRAELDEATARHGRLRGLGRLLEQPLDTEEPTRALGLGFVLHARTSAGFVSRQSVQLLQATPDLGLAPRGDVLELV